MQLAGGLPDVSPATIVRLTLCPLYFLGDFSDLRKWTQTCLAAGREHNESRSSQRTCIEEFQTYASAILRQAQDKLHTDDENYKSCYQKNFP